MFHFFGENRCFPHHFVPNLHPFRPPRKSSEPSSAAAANDEELRELREAQAKAEAKVKTLEKRLAKYATRRDMNRPINKNPGGKSP
jgi:hypothetical protein